MKTFYLDKLTKSEQLSYYSTACNTLQDDATVGQATRLAETLVKKDFMDVYRKTTNQRKLDAVLEKLFYQ